MERKGIIYCLHCISTGKKYIGQTRQSLKNRMRSHTSAYKNTQKVRSKLYHQLKKTGWDDFIIGVIGEFNLSELNEREVFYIEKYDTLNNGLNTVPGGGKFPVYIGEDHPMYGKSHSKEAKNKISKNHHDVSGENNPMYGKKFTKEHVEKIKLAYLKNPHVNGKKWWNNGEIEVRSETKPGDEYVKGRLSKAVKHNLSTSKSKF